MPDPRFFHRAGPFSLTEIGTRVGAVMASPGTPDLSLSDISVLDAAGPGDVVYVADVSNLPALGKSECSACLVKEAWIGAAPTGAAVLVVKDPR